MSGDRDITKEMAEMESAKEASSQSETLFISLSVGIIFGCLYFSHSFITDDSIQIFKCPVMREMDAPVAMKKISDIDSYDAEIYIRGFVRQYIRALYPKNSLEAEELFRFIAQHSLGKEKEVYGGYLNDFKKIGDSLDQGRSTDFFPVSSTDIRISKNTLSSSWIVEIDGFMNNRHSALEDDRGAVTLRLEVVKDSARLGGSHSGLYVSNLEVVSMTDPVANNQKNVK